MPTENTPTTTGSQLWERYQTTQFGTSNAVTKVLKDENEADALCSWLNQNRGGNYEVKQTNAGGYVIKATQGA